MEKQNIGRTAKADLVAVEKPTKAELAEWESKLARYGLSERQLGLNVPHAHLSHSHPESEQPIEYVGDLADLASTLDEASSRANVTRPDTNGIETESTL